MSLIEQKQRLRQQVESLRSGLSEAQRREKSQRICERLLSQLKMEQAGERTASASNIGGNPPVLLTFMPFGAEVDITPVTDWCWEQGWTVVAPRVGRGGRDRELFLHEISGYDDLQTGMWGIREPKPTAPVFENFRRITAALVPGMAFDPSMGRLGYGGGYYDRLLRKFDGQLPFRPLLLAPAYEVQIVPRVPMEDHDVRVDQVVTESRILCRRPDQ